MAAQLILRLASQVGSPVGNLQVRYVNTTNTPILSVAWLDSGVAIADDYTLTVLTKNGSALTVKVEANVKNPYVSLTGLPATADGTTVNKTLIPGIGIVLSASADVGWAAKVTVGDYMDAGGAITHVGVFGVVQSGQVTTGVRVAAVNVGDAPAQNTVLYALPGGFYFGSGYEVLIQTIKPHSDPSRHKMASPATLSITFANWGTDSGTGKKKADVKVGGTTAIVGALFDGATVYQWGSGNGYVDNLDLLPGLQLVLANTTSDPSAVTITLSISDGWNWVQFAADSGGTPGTYANQDLVLTESEQPSGTITVGGAGFFWINWAPPGSAQAGAMRKMLTRVRGLTT
jgi:hypothetical protein